MPRSSCQPCCNPTELSRSQDSYRSAVLLILCGIFQSLTFEDIGELETASGEVDDAGENIVITAADVNEVIYVYGESIMTTSSTEVLSTLLDGTGGQEKSRVNLRAPTDVSVGSNRLVTAPAYLYKTSPGNDLILNLSAGVDVHYTLNFYRGT